MALKLITLASCKWRCYPKKEFTELQPVITESYFLLQCYSCKGKGRTDLKGNTAFAKSKFIFFCTFQLVLIMLIWQDHECWTWTYTIYIDIYAYLHFLSATNQNQGQPCETYSNSQRMTNKYREEKKERNINNWALIKSKCPSLIGTRPVCINLDWKLLQ